MNFVRKIQPFRWGISCEGKKLVGLVDLWHWPMKSCLVWKWPLHITTLLTMDIFCPWNFTFESKWISIEIHTIVHEFILWIHTNGNFTWEQNITLWTFCNIFEGIAEWSCNFCFVCTQKFGMTINVTKQSESESENERERERERARASERESESLNDCVHQVKLDSN